MLLEESIWIRCLLQEYCPFGSTVLNIGSSSGYYREVIQPHIHENIILPVLRNGGTVLNQDLKDCEGVDLPGNIFSQDVQRRLLRMDPFAVICSNMLEHVANLDRFASVLSELVKPGCLLVVTVPYIYPYHPDPIDNGYRPTPCELAGLFKGFAVERSGIVQSSSGYLKSILDRGLVGFVKFLIRLLLPVNGMLGWKREWCFLRYAFVPYSASCIALRRVVQ